MYTNLSILFPSLLYETNFIEDYLRSMYFTGPKTGDGSNISVFLKHLVLLFDYYLFTIIGTVSFWIGIIAVIK